MVRLSYSDDITRRPFSLATEGQDWSHILYIKNVFTYS